VHPSSRAAFSYYSSPLDIGTAAGTKSLKSEGVGALKLYTPKGDIMSGFDRVIFCKGVAEKLASVGEISDAGLVCVFDNEKLTTYKKHEVVIEGKIFTCDARDPKSRLYPITLFRKKGETNANAIPAIPPTPAILPAAMLAQNENKYESLPAEIPDGPLPASLLARTYIKPGLSELDRYHAKFGDVGIKYMKRCLPALKVPKKYRCDICIEGKIHKFGHHACAEGAYAIFTWCVHSH